MPTLFAPAKINLTLEILSRRADGYHALRSVMLPIGLYDRIVLEPSSATRFVASDPALAHDNLVMRALAASGVATPYDVRLEKTIPVGGGLGGGSSDAAAVLRAAMAGELGAAEPRDWVEVALGLGSDVPFFLAGTGALVEGFGERVTALGALPRWWALVARPHASVATADAYRRLDAARSDRATPSRPRATSASLAAIEALQRGDFGALVASLVNDFHDVVLAAYPAVARADAALRDAGATHALLSGSGSCLFALFEDEARARAVASRVAADACEAVLAVPFHHDAAWRRAAG
ncbi:MAG: 4-(cytidine 5'-diphospho)-2-C-methyl-D-erythritol kinase [Vulcanimicrobiaceae bacterium]